jgi:hypothetical protein
MGTQRRGPARASRAGKPSSVTPQDQRGAAGTAPDGYVLTRGLYIGSTVDVSMRQGEGKFLYSKTCRYLYLTGVRDIGSGAESPSRETAEAMPCAPLGHSD